MLVETYFNNQTIVFNADQVVSITAASSTDMQGMNSIIKMSDKTIIESTETVAELKEKCFPQNSKLLNE